MTAALLLDLHGSARIKTGPGQAAPAGLSEALSSLQGQAANLLTDWGPGAVSGVATVLGTASTAPALLEKQLRDRGETDDISHLVVHQAKTSMGNTELLYTAVPIRTWQRYQQLATAHPSLLLMHDWVRTLLTWARGHELNDGLMLVMHPEGLDAMQLQQGRVRWFERLRVFQGETQAWERLGQRVATTTRERQDADAAATPAVPPAVLWVLSGAEADAPALTRGLSPLLVTECWAEQPQAVAALDEDARIHVQALSATEFNKAMQLAQAVNRPLDKAAALAERWSLPVGLAGMALSALMAVTAGVMHYRTQQGFAELGQNSESQALWQTLNADVLQADKLAKSQDAVRQWLGQRVSNAKVPNINNVLVQLRRALPPGLVIDEIGLAADKDGHLLTVIGHALDVEDSLREEAHFAQALQADGFTLSKRELLLRDGQPRFKLSMTWSAS